MSALFGAGSPARSPRFVSHRGYTPLAPENSLPGFAYAGMLRQWAIETDVHVTSDGVLVCCHDATVDGMYDGTGAIREQTWAQLSRLRLARGARLECFEKDQLGMPLLSQYLQICRTYGSVPFLELKTPDAGRVLRAVREAGFAEDEVVMSASRLPWLEDARAEAPRLFLHHIFSNEDAMGRLSELGNAGVSWKVADPHDLPAGAVAAAHEQGLKVCLRAADSAADVATMRQLGLDYLPTNTMHTPPG